MPKCRTCGANIIFAQFEPDRFGNSGKPLPVNISPDPNGSIAFYESPSPTSNYPPERDAAAVRQTFARRMSGPAVVESYLRAGGSLYRIHFDTCGTSGDPFVPSPGALEARGVSRY